MKSFSWLTCFHRWDPSVCCVCAYILQSCAVNRLNILKHIHWHQQNILEEMNCIRPDQQCPQQKGHTDFPKLWSSFWMLRKITCLASFWLIFLYEIRSYCFLWLDHNQPRIVLERIVLPRKISLRSRWQDVIRTRLYHNWIYSITTHQQPGNPLLQFCALFPTFWSTLEWRRKTVTQRWS